MFLLKLQMFLQKGFFRLIMLAALLMFCGVFVFAVHLEEKSKLPQDMRLPEGVEFGKPVVGSDSAASGPLTIQHMSADEVGNRLTSMAVEALSFDAASYNSTIAGVGKYFTESGYGQYKQFLDNSGFEQALTTGNLQAGAYVEGVPQLLGRGVYSNAYKWVFEVPVTISLIPRTATTYEKDLTKPENRHFTLRAQMARVNDPQDPNAVKIELWQVLPPKNRK